MNLQNLSTKARQYWLAAAVGTVVIVSVGFIVYFIVDDGPSGTQLDNPNFSADKQIASLSPQLNAQELWVERIESENKLMREKVTALEKLLMESLKNTHEQSSALSQIKEQLTVAQNLADSNALQNSLATSSNNDSNQPNFDDPRFAQPTSSFDQLQQPQMPMSAHKIVIMLKADHHSKKDQRKTVENTIPAGAYASAILLGGVDAATSINAQGDPRPVLLRITDQGTLPRRFKSDLKACHVLASSYGDLSSERVYMRLEKLTCTEPLTGEIIETQVAGYITGEDGRAGVRGTVVDRAGEAIRNSFVAGFVGGMGSFLGAQQQRAAFPISPFGQSNALDAHKMIGAGAAQGTNNAMEKLADFYIKRADQLQPVLQVAAGRQVNIIFTQGSDIGSSSVKQAIKKVRDQSRHETVSKLEGETDKADWLPSPIDSKNTPVNDTQPITDISQPNEESDV